eukprot:COSAG01_NODE_2303_length_7952_cov_4.127849_2_plen_137_part_00
MTGVHSNTVKMNKGHFAFFYFLCAWPCPSFYVHNVRTPALDYRPSIGLVRADMKCFQASSGVRFAWATIEVMDVSLIYAKVPQIVGELRLLKEDRSRFYQEQGSSDPELQYAFLPVVDIVHQTSKVLLCGGMEVMR